MAGTKKKTTTVTPISQPGFRPVKVYAGTADYSGITFAIGTDDSGMAVKVKIYGAEVRTPRPDSIFKGHGPENATRVEAIFFRLCASLVEAGFGPHIGADWHAQEGREGRNVSSIPYELSRGEVPALVAGQIAAVVEVFARKGVL